MLNITKRVEYALMALKFLVEKSPPPETTSITVTAREISDHFNIPFDTISKVMQTLTHHHVLKSHQGIKGGYSLGQPLKEINYYQLNMWLEGESFGHYCQTSERTCDQFNHCNIYHPLHTFNQNINEYFQKISLESLLFEKRPIQNGK
jgi:Rrf2 family protein